MTGFFYPSALTLPTYSKLQQFVIPGIKIQAEGWEGKSVLVYMRSIIREVWWEKAGRGHFVCQLLFYSWQAVCWVAPPQLGGLKPWHLLGYELV